MTSVWAPQSSLRFGVLGAWRVAWLTEEAFPSSPYCLSGRWSRRQPRSPSCRCCGWIIIILLLHAQQAPSALQCVPQAIIIIIVVAVIIN